MQAPRETLTDNLADIIQLIHLGSKDGTLTVERSNGAMTEEGYLVFVNGAVVEAKVGNYIGPVAFNYLNTWRTCRFSFVSGAATAPTLPLPYSGNGTNGASADVIPAARATTPLPGNTGTGAYGRGSAPPYSFPTRLPAGEEMLQYVETTQMPRIHRRLLLLVNGQRSVNELARLMGRSLVEVQALLHDLEQAGLIRQ